MTKAPPPLPAPTTPPPSPTSKNRKSDQIYSRNLQQEAIGQEVQHKVMKNLLEVDPAEFSPKETRKICKKTLTGAI